ncbi:50S ribosomal protein L19, chloroplastic [Plasmodiophora brassicae]|uniref:50S ribosomal protein L19, chloroplastic n=2 Tax=Plasmodiophora brassicae TaxID=37360 RepID=A0A3P3YLA7_PLABS|nr:unnamed protein product [Plasmodiophora brassicae]
MLCAALRTCRRSTATLSLCNRLLREAHEREVVRMTEARGFSMPPFRVGDWVRFEMPQTLSPEDNRKPDVIEGLVICKRGKHADSNFIVRSYEDELGCERTIPMYSPWIRNFTVIKQQKVRRAKLYYMRKRDTLEL